MEKKQSPVEYLVSEIENIGFSVNNTLEFYDTVQIAREMHKEEIEDAYQKGRFNGQTNWGYGNDITAEQYYNETYNNENTDTTT